MKKIKIADIEYEIIRNDNDCLNKEDLSEKITDYFDVFDYIMGDYAYEKVRLKGFNESNQAKTTKLNDYKNIENYIENYCSYGSNIFIIKKIK